MGQKKILHEALALFCSAGIHNAKHNLEQLEVLWESANTVVERMTIEMYMEGVANVLATTE